MKWTYLAWVVVAAMLVTAPMALAADKVKAKAKGTVVNGELTKVGTESIEVSVKGKEKGAAPEVKTLGIDSSTEIMVEKEPAAGAEKGKAKPEKGTVADLTVGKRVTVRCSEDGKKALEILVRLSGSHKRGGGKK